MMRHYPWHQGLWQRLVEQRQRLPHALLLHGRAGSGKLDFAIRLSQYLLCEQPTADGACQQCHKCVWFAEGHHPDFKLVEPEEDTSGKKKTNKSSQLSVAQIRQLALSLSLSNHNADGLRVALIHPAEAMNVAAANALLKILEEPPNNTIFILVCHQVKHLLPTITSRCQRIAMPMPEHHEALQWLQSQQVEDAEALLAYSGGAPLAVMQLQEMGLHADVYQQLALGENLDSAICGRLMAAYPMEQALTILQKWLYDVQLQCYAVQQHYHVQYMKPLQMLAKRVNLSRLLAFQKTLLQAKQTANHPLNQALQLENLLLQYKKVFNH